MIYELIVYGLQLVKSSHDESFLRRQLTCIFYCLLNSFGVAKNSKFGFKTTNLRFAIRVNRVFKNEPGLVIVGHDFY